MIIIELIYNLAVLIAVSVVSGFVDNRISKERFAGKLFQGILFGFTSVIGMMYPFVLYEGIIFDGRSVVLSICGLFFGPIPAIIAGLMAFAYRAYIGGPGMYMGLITIIQSIFWGLLFLKYKKTIDKGFNTKTLYLMGLAVHITMILSMLGLPSLFRINTFQTISLTVIIFYPLATILIGKIILDHDKSVKLIDELKQSEENFRNYIQFAPDVVFVTDRNGNYILANPAAERVTGYSKDEILKMTIKDITEPSEYSFAEKHFNDVVTKGFATGETKYIHKDGSIRWWSIDAVKISDNKFIGFSKDITERKAQEYKLESTLAKFVTFFELAPDPMGIINLEDLVYIDVNQAFLEITGYKKNEIIGHSSKDFKFWLDDNMKMEFLSLVNLKGICRNFESDFQNRHGQIFHLSVSASILNILNDKYLLIVLSDQTYQKKVQNEVKLNENRYRSLIENLPDGFYQSTSEGKFLYVNPAFVKILGYDSKEELMSIDIQNALYFHPDERHLTENLIISNNNNFEIYRLKRKDGSEVWIEEHSRYIENEFGNVVIHQGICRDITERLKIENEKNELIDRINKVSQHLPGFIYQYCLRPDGTSCFPFSTIGMKTVYGINPEDVRYDIGDYIEKIIYAEDIERVFKIIAKSAQELSIWHDTYRVVHPDNKIIWVEGWATPEKLSDGSVLWHGYITDISDRVQKEKQIIESEQSLQMSQEIAKIGSFEYDVITNQVRWSDNLYKIFGYSKDIVPNQDTIHRIIHPDDLELLNSKIGKFNQNPVLIDFELRIIRNNEVVWLHSNIMPFLDNDKLVMIKGTYQDITERKKIENELRKLSRAVSQNPLAVVITDLNGKIEYVNPKFTEITGFMFEEAFQKNPRILKSGVMSSDFYENMWNQLKNKNQWYGEILNKKKNGEHYWASLLIAPVSDDKGEITNYIAISEDITEKIEMNKQLIIAKEKAEESDKLKSAFLANMSHEIRTPMNGIIGFSRMLTEPDLDESERDEFVQLINQSCNRLINTVNDILDISKIEAKQMEIKPNNFDIILLIEEMNDIYLRKCIEKGVNFIIKVPDNIIDLVIFSDEQKIYQILNNLLSNAIKFTDNGFIELGCSVLENDILEFYVSDTGIGISEENLEHIFGRFNQGDYSLSRSFEGSGLGLAICKGLIDLIGGKIWVESKLGVGSVFKFTIPIK